MINVLVWNENFHERNQPEVAAIYPDGIHGCIGGFLSAEEEISVKCVTFDMENQGLSDELLSGTDVLIWWGHKEHHRLTEENAELVCRHIQGGMGLIALHSSHYSKIFKKLMGTTCSLRWRHGDREKVWCSCPSHPIALGVPDSFDIPAEEMYGEPFDIPNPDDTVFMGWFSGGEVFRSGVTFRRGKGKIFYFQPGHEEYPVYYDKNVQKIIINAVKWCCPQNREHSTIPCVMSKPAE